MILPSSLDTLDLSVDRVRHVRLNLGFYCASDLSRWYLDDAASWHGMGWTFTGANVCPGGSVSVIKTNPFYYAPPEPTYIGTYLVEVVEGVAFDGPA